MTNTATTVVTSTSHLTPDGILGYAKGIAGAITAILVAVVAVLPDGQWHTYVTIAIAVLGAISVIVVPNAVKPVVVAAS